MGDDGMLLGGIDLGGTKIEARLFAGPEAASVDHRRWPTPRSGAEHLVAAIAGAVSWLDERAGTNTLPVGLALPGRIDPVSGVVFAANIPTGDSPLAQRIAAAVGRPVPLLNDAMGFALSEAQGGAGAGAGSVLGLILGTGLGAGLALRGALPPRASGLAVEIGHLPLPAGAAARHGLPLLQCGCGKRGCLERYLSGPGIAALAAHLGAPFADGQALARALAAGDPAAATVLALWSDIAGEGLQALQLMLDPEVIVLGGGLSSLPGLPDALSRGLAAHALPGIAPPPVRLARHGDSSGARGAALWARAKRAQG